MKIIYFICAVGLLGLQAIHGQQTIASAKVDFEFTSKNVDGSIAGFQSSSDIDLENPDNSTFKGSVTVESLKTGNFLRDWSLKGGKYFDEDEYPRISFESTEISLDGDLIKVKGKLTIKNKTLDQSISFEKRNNQLIGTMTLNSSDYGISIKKERADNKVVVTLTLDLE